MTRFPSIGVCAFFMSGLAAAIFAMTVSAEARMREQRTAPQDFYAYAGERAPAHPAQAHSGDCFVSNTPAEAAKGMRHWSGSC